MEKEKITLGDKKMFPLNFPESKRFQMWTLRFRPE